MIAIESQTYSLQRSKRKTVCITFTKECKLLVKAPLRMPKSAIDLFVQKHEGWIVKHRLQLEQAAVSRQKFTFADGDVVYYLGKPYSICTGSLPVRLEGDCLVLPASASDREGLTSDFLRRSAKGLIPERVALFAARMGVQPAGVTITSARTRWGSCSGKNRLNFSYRCACLPPELLDYIVVHELAHIRQHNHSARFYAEVAAILPPHAQLRAQVRTFHEKLCY